MYSDGFRIKLLLLPGIILVCLWLTQCKKNDVNHTAVAGTGILSFVLNNGSISIVHKERKEIVVYIADYVERSELVAVFQLYPGASARVGDTPQYSSRTVNDFTNPVIYTIRSAIGEEENWTVNLEPNDQLIGFKGKIGRQNRLRSTNDFYISQDSTGYHSSVNGGPACLAMVLRWARPTEFPTVNAATIRQETALPNMFNTVDVCKYLSSKMILWKALSVNSSKIGDSEIVACIDSGYLVMLCADFAQITYNMVESEHTERFWPISKKSNGHYIIIKGYKEIDGSLYYEAYDPYSKNECYSGNGEKKGRNRYYHAVSILRAMCSADGWKYALAIKPRNMLTDKRLKGEVVGDDAKKMFRNSKPAYGF